MSVEEEDDYMSMTLTEPSTTFPETTLQRRARQKREAEARARPKSKAERAAEEAAAREAALATSLDSSNKGFKMMQKLGFKGGALGKKYGEEEARTEPVELVMKEGRGGVGMDSEKKRKFREEAQEVDKRVKADEGEYRERLVREREAKRYESLFIGAMSVAEKLDEEDDVEPVRGTEGEVNAEAEDLSLAGEEREANVKRSTTTGSKPLSKINVLWRATVRHRIEAERERRMRYDLYQSLSRRPTYDDPDEDAEDRQALGKEEEEIEEEDSELDDFLALEPQERLQRIVEYMRERWFYCFWCKRRYENAEMEGCPGKTEEDHD